MTKRYALRDDQWDRIKDLLPGRAGTVGVTARNNRLFVEAVLYRYRAGIPWRDLPERFGDFRVIHTRFSRWSQKGVWQRVFEVLCADADNEYAMLDSTIVRAHQHSAGKRGIKPLDAAGADALLDPQRIRVWIADRGYDAQKRVLERIEACGSKAVIPSRKHRLTQRDHDRWQYRSRHLIENFFARLKQYRAIATRYDKTACNFLGAIHLAAIVIWLN